jgi:hypothetical protein
MKVNIKTGAALKKYDFISSWDDVTMETWLELLNFKEESKPLEAIKTIESLSNIPKDVIKTLELSDVALLMNKASALQKEKDTVLKKTFTIDDVEYGMLPDLDAMTLGEYADIETYIKAGMENNMPEIMAILFRPVTEKGENNMYTIQAYDGNISIRAEIMKKMNSLQVQEALVFFWHLGSVLSTILPSCLTHRVRQMKAQ